MQQPPPIPEFQVPKRNNTLSYILIGISFFCILTCAVGGYMGFQKMKSMMGEVTPVLGCTLDAKAVRDGLIAYANKTGKFPNAATWQDDVVEMVKIEMQRPLSKKEKMPFKVPHMDVNGTWGCLISREGDPDKWSTFAFNSELSGKPIKEILGPSAVPLIMETPKSGRNLSIKPSDAHFGPGPTIMGEDRNWIVANIEGEIAFTDGKGAKIKVGTD